MKSDESIDEKELVSRRVFTYSADQIFSAFSNPELLKEWWGPAGFTNTFSEFDFREGGQWEFIMHGPDGKDYPNHSIFHEIEKPIRIVLEHTPPPHFVLTISLASVSGGTEVTWRMLFDSAKTRDGVAKYAGDANEQNFDRLGALLARIGDETSK